MTDKKTLALSLLSSGKSASEVAAECGVTKPTVYAWKKGVAPNTVDRESLEVEKLRLEVGYWKGLAELYKRELGRLAVG